MRTDEKKKGHERGKQNPRQWLSQVFFLYGGGGGGVTHEYIQSMQFPFSTFGMAL